MLVKLYKIYRLNCRTYTDIEIRIFLFKIWVFQNKLLYTIKLCTISFIYFGGITQLMTTLFAWYDTLF